MGAIDYGSIWLFGMFFTFLVFRLKAPPLTLESGFLQAGIGVIWFIVVPAMMVSSRFRAFILEKLNRVG